jgi:transcriptional regulator with XRE-family HTH domain
VPSSSRESRTRGAEPSPFAHFLDGLVPAVFESEAAFARAVGVPQSTVSRWRRGETRPRVEQLLTLSEVTGTSIEMLVRIAGYRPSARPRGGDQS